jgi:hypothetical protein
MSIGAPEIVLTRSTLVKTVLRCMAEQSPPFGRNEWHATTVRLPELWIAGFEVLNWANTLMTLLAVLSVSKHGMNEGVRVLREIVTQLQESKPGQKLATVLLDMSRADALPDKHPVFGAAEGQRFSMHQWAFARAEAGLSRLGLPEGERIDAMGKLAACFVYNNVYASERFGALVEKLRFVETEEEMRAGNTR